jgi:hypothetical protein
MEGSSTVMPELLVPIMEALIGIILVYGVKVSSDTRRELRKLNGRTGRLEQWKEDHELLDNERFDSVNKRIEALD